MSCASITVDLCLVGLQPDGHVTPAVEKSSSVNNGNIKENKIYWSTLQVAAGKVRKLKHDFLWILTLMLRFCVPFFAALAFSFVISNYSQATRDTVVADHYAMQLCEQRTVRWRLSLIALPRLYSMRDVAVVVT